MRTRRPHAVSACAWITGCIAGLAGLVCACGQRDAPRDTLVYDIWSGGGATVAAETPGDSNDPSAPEAQDPNDLIGSPPGDGETVVAGETAERGDAPVLEVSVAVLDFGETETVLTFQVHNAGGGSMEYTIVGDQSWMTASPDSGLNEGTYDTISVQAERTGLAAGTYAGALAIATPDGQQETVSVSMTVAAPAEPPDPPPPPAEDGSNFARAAYFYWDWSTDEADIEAFVPLLVGHYTSACIVFIGAAAKVQANVEHVLSISHPAELIVGLTTGDLLSSLEDVAGWHALGSLAAWCVARTGVPRIGLDIEFSLDSYLYHDVPFDLAKYEEGLRAFATYIPDVQVYFYPPNYEGFSEANMKTVLQRTRGGEVLAKLPRHRSQRFHVRLVFGASPGSPLSEPGGLLVGAGRSRGTDLSDRRHLVGPGHAAADPADDSARMLALRRAAVQCRQG
jgi:hypothetical protein